MGQLRVCQCLAVADFAHAHFVVDFSIYLGLMFNCTNAFALLHVRSNKYESFRNPHSAIGKLADRRLIGRRT